MLIKGASLDASFWINLHDMGLVNHLPNYFRLYVAPKVVEEVEYIAPGLMLPTPAGQLFYEWRSQAQITVQEPNQKVDWFDPGENEAIALAREHGYVLLIDDQVPYHFVKSRDLRSVASADFVVLLVADGALSEEQALSRLARSNMGVHLKRAAMIAVRSFNRRE